MIVTDCAIVFCFMISIIFIEKMQARAIVEFKDFKNQLSTRDFAIQVSNLPNIRDYKNEEILKGLLFNHFERIARSQK